MSENEPKECDIGVLASDLDGTLIPLEGNQQNKIDLVTLTNMVERNQIELVFSSGRHLKSVQQAIKEFSLPVPGWIICDVGSSVYRKHSNGTFKAESSYSDRLQQILGLDSIGSLSQNLQYLTGLRLQESEKQGRFKLSYYCDADQLQNLIDSIESTLRQSEITVQIIGSVDPFNGDGLIDLLPIGITKASSLKWWAETNGFSNDSIVFAGDSGNDLAAMTAGYRTIVVGNADREIAVEVSRHHQAQGWRNRIHLAQAVATSGVLEGCQRFGIV